MFILGSEVELRVKDIAGGLNSSTEDEELVRIKIGDNLVWAGDSGDAISGGDMILESGAGGIGTETDFVIVDLKENGALTARAAQNIYIEEIVGDYDFGFGLDTIYTPNTVTLRGVDIYDAFDPVTPDLENVELVNIKAGTIILDVTGDIGVTDPTPYAPLNAPPHYFLGNYYIEVVDTKWCCCGCRW